MNKIVVTGGCGFIGSHFCELFQKEYPNSRIHVFDKLGIGGELEHIAHIKNCVHWNVDIANEMPAGIPHIDAIFHFAAESHVDRSINTPQPFVKNNINATLNVLNYVKEHPHVKMINISTDEVYGALGVDESSWYEDSPLLPNSPYSASKASSDMLCRAYHKTYGLDIVTTRCTNNFGSRQHSEKFIPTIVHCIVYEIPIPIYGDGKNMRDWIPVQSHIRAILDIGKKETSGVFNIGHGWELQNIFLANMIREICKEKGYESEIEYVEDRKGHDFRYSMNTYFTDYIQYVKWEDFDKYLRSTVDYYITKYEREKAQV